MPTPRPTPLTGFRLLLEKHVRRDLLGGISRGTLWNIRKTDPTFPRAVKLTAGLIAFREDEIRAWIAARPQAEDLLRTEAPASGLPEEEEEESLSAGASGSKAAALKRRADR